MLKVKTWILLALPLLLATPAFAFQSGSRVVGSNSFGQVVSGNFSAPVPQRTSCSRSVQPVVTYSQPVVVQSQPQIQYQQPVQTVRSVQAQPVQNFSNTVTSSSTRVIDPAFQVNNPNSPYAVDHTPWNQFLSRNLINDSQGVSRVYYGQVSGQDRQLLSGYLSRLQGTDIRTLNRNEQFAFWVNLYNARTVALVLDNYPVSSIQQVNGGQAFDDKSAVNVLGKNLSLNDIESGIIRPVWNDARIHYALNCGAYGCPNLARTAYSSQNLNSQLNSAAQTYINSDRAVQRTATGIRVSKIYDWYKEDFGGSDQGVISHISQYANPTTLSKISGVGSIEGYYYDWSLNDASGYSSSQPVSIGY